MQQTEIGVIASPSTTDELTVHLADDQPILGDLVTVVTAGVQVYGQVTNVTLYNELYDTRRISTEGNLRVATVRVGAAYTHPDGVPTTLRNVPDAGTPVCRTIARDLAFEPYADQLFWLSEGLPMWFRHFGAGSQGTSEAYHTGVFGKTGSGKSGLAKMLLTAYSRHPEMGVLIIDPQGEFSRELDGTQVGQQGLPLRDTLTASGRSIEVYRVRDLALDTWDLFEALLVTSNLLQDAIGIRAQQSVDLAAEIVRTALETHHTLPSLNNKDALASALLQLHQQANRIYSGKERAAQLRASLAELANDTVLETVYTRYWLPLTELFASGNTLSDVVEQLLNTTTDRAVVSIDLSQAGQGHMWSPELQSQILTVLLERLVQHASQTLTIGDTANLLVLLDEAHRFAPSGYLERESNAATLRDTLRSAVRETRKYGLGWFFVSQTVASLDTDIVQQLSSLFFGAGLALGDEFDSLKQLVGGDTNALSHYQSFRHPQNSPTRELRQFPFMAVGPVSPLSLSGQPLFFQAYTDPTAFITQNFGG